MRFSRKIKINTEEEKVEIQVKFKTKTRDFMANESRNKFNCFFDKLLEALQYRYHFEEIKIKRTKKRK